MSELSDKQSCSSTRQIQLSYTEVEQFIANGLCKGSIYALVALGFGLIYTTSGVFHIAHGFVYVAAAYALYWMGSVLKLPMALSILGAFGIVTLLGMFMEAVVYRPLERNKASPAVLMISSFGIYIAGVNILGLLFGNDTKSLAPRIPQTFHLHNIVLSRIQVVQLICGVLLFVAYWIFLRRTALGRTCRAVADDPALASVLGIRVEGTRLLVFAVGSVLAGAGAFLGAFDVGMDPQAGLPIVLAAAVACIIGGLHRFLAPAIGGLILGILQSVVVWKTSAHWESGVTFAILILFLLFRPQGLIGRVRRIEEAR